MSNLFFIIFRFKNIILLKNKDFKHIYLIKDIKLHIMTDFGDKKLLKSIIKEFRILDLDQNFDFFQQIFAHNFHENVIIT